MECNHKKLHSKRCRSSERMQPPCRRMHTCCGRMHFHSHRVEFTRVEYTRVRVETEEVNSGGKEMVKLIDDTKRTTNDLKHIFERLQLLNDGELGNDTAAMESLSQMDKTLDSIKERVQSENSQQIVRSHRSPARSMPAHRTSHFKKN